MTAHSSGACFYILVYRCDTNFNEVLTYCVFYLSVCFSSQHLYNKGFVVFLHWNCHSSFSVCI